MSRRVRPATTRWYWRRAMVTSGCSSRSPLGQRVARLLPGQHDRRVCVADRQRVKRRSARVLPGRQAEWLRADARDEDADPSPVRPRAAVRGTPGDHLKGPLGSGQRGCSRKACVPRLHQSHPHASVLARMLAYGAARRRAPTLSGVYYQTPGSWTSSPRYRVPADARPLWTGLATDGGHASLASRASGVRRRRAGPVGSRRGHVQSDGRPRPRPNCANIWHTVGG